jgi:Family of unknown function (DUF6335)
MAKKKAPVRKAARKAAGRARTAMKKVARRATSARRSAKTAVKKAVKKTVRTTAKATKSVKKAASSMKKAASSVKKVATSAKKAATTQVKSAGKQVGAAMEKAKAQQQSVAKSASTALGKAKTLAKAVTAGVTAALTPPPVARASAGAKARPKRPPSLDRERRTVREIHGAPSTLGGNVSASAAKSGRDDLRHKLERHTSSSPALTAGDVDADWESADSSGDEAPGGDNPTPDQDVVEEIGRALGVEYDDDEELQGGDEIADRDRHRWELDPDSKEDTDDRD